MFSHAFAEEAVLWPAVRASLPDGEELTLRIEQEHQEINELVRRLEGSRNTHPGRAELLERVRPWPDLQHGRAGDLTPAAGRQRRAGVRAR